jgi:hypothetical protein
LLGPTHPLACVCAEQTPSVPDHGRVGHQPETGPDLGITLEFCDQFEQPFHVRSGSCPRLADDLHVRCCPPPHQPTPANSPNGVGRVLIRIPSRISLWRRLAARRSVEGVRFSSAAKSPLATATAARSR